MSEPFRAGERALLIDSKARRYLVTLTPGKEFHTHAGGVAHDELIGSSEGTRVRTGTGAGLVAVRPSLTDFILKMPRGAQVVYPKDIATIIMQADIFPGARVLEAGTGSGALTLGLLRAVGPTGHVITYEAREDHAQKARANIETFMGELPPWLEMRAGDVTEGVEDEVDRAVFDFAEPWRAVPIMKTCLAPGGIFCSYVPTVPQVQQVTDALRGAGFIDVTTTETLIRSWRIEGQSVRPDHRMVGHTGFITIGRSLGV